VDFGLGQITRLVRQSPQLNILSSQPEFNFRHIQQNHLTGPQRRIT
jgi:hypothetical protein